MGEVEVAEETPGADVAVVETEDVVEAELVPFEPETFEGAEVDEWELRLPSTSIECDRSFKRGSILRLAVEVRLRNVGYTEKRDGKMLRVHSGVIEDISVLSVFDPTQNRENVAGSLSGSNQTDIEDDEPGVVDAN